MDEVAGVSLGGELWRQADGSVMQVHRRAVCAGRPCCIHRPSAHHMRDWRQQYRFDRALMERICEHGVGHPDPDDLALLTDDLAGVHGCDGCCTRRS